MSRLGKNIKYMKLACEGLKVDGETWIKGYLDAEIAKFEEKMGECELKELPKEDRDKLKKKLLFMYFNQYDYDNLSNKEKRALPGFLFDDVKGQQEEAFTKFIIKGIRDNWTGLFGEVISYLQNYATNNPIVEAVGSDIKEKFRLKEYSNSKFAKWSKNPYLFGRFGHMFLSKRFSKEGYLNLLEETGLVGVCEGTKFVQEAILAFFDDARFGYAETSRRGTKADIRYEVFKEIISRKVENSCVQDAIVPQIIKYLIMSYKASGGRTRPEFIDDVINLKGDPRLPRNKHIWWTYIEKEATSLFVSWLSQRDIRLFFEIIKQGAETDYTAMTMWRERQQFWEKHINEITNAWLLLGESSETLVKRMKGKSIQYYGRLKGGSQAKSAIKIEIGNYTIIERSHNGAVYIWENERCPIASQVNRPISESDITGTGTEYKKVVHKGSWQDRIELVLKGHEPNW